MNYLPEEDANRLLDEAKTASEDTYSPYSGFPVEAAVLMQDGLIYRGANFENALYSITICVERIALGHAVSAGNIEIRAVAVFSNKSSISPCGACPQFIIEFGVNIIIVFKQDNKIIQKIKQELLPFGFTLATMML